MKKFFCILLVLALTLGLCACSSSGETKEETGLQVGFARVKSVPDQFPVHIAGNDVGKDVCEGSMLDELTVTCIALKQGEETILIYTCDIVDIEASFYKETEAAIARETGLPVEKIVLNATHTHSAPTLKDKQPGKDAYLIKFNKSCAKAGVDAIADLSPATISYGSIMTENMAFVRHYLMMDGSTYGNGHGSEKAGIKEHHYPADGECQVIRFTRAAEDKKDVVMMNMGVHATYVNGTDGTLSADFPGVARQYVEQTADVLAAYFIAAAGDQVGKSKVPGQTFHSDYKSYGTALGEYVVECLGSMTEASADGMSLYTETYTAKRMKEGTEDPTLMAHAQEIVTLKNQYGNYSNDAVKSKVAEYGFSSFYEAQGLITRSKAPETGTLPVTAMKLGSIGIVFASYEMFSTHGTWLKENTPLDMTFVITCSEDDKAYIPNDIACEHSYYEYDVTPYARGTGQALVERCNEILTALRDGQTPAPLAPLN